MKKVLCFGDSNIFGFNPLDGSRFDKNSRWSGILAQKLLKKNIEVVEDGLNNRTCFAINQTPQSTGLLAIEKYYQEDIDEIIVAIGINDLQKNYNVTLKDFENGLKKFVLKLKRITVSEILLLIPSKINSNILNSNFVYLFDESSIEKSQKLIEIYKNVALENKCQFLDLNKIAKVSKIDSLHYEKEEHLKIAKEILKYF